MAGAEQAAPPAPTDSREGGLRASGWASGGNANDTELRCTPALHGRCAPADAWMAGLRHGPALTGRRVLTSPWGWAGSSEPAALSCDTSRAATDRSSRLSRLHASPASSPSWAASPPITTPGMLGCSWEVELSADCEAPSRVGRKPGGAALRIREGSDPSDAHDQPCPRDKQCCVVCVPGGLAPTTGDGLVCASAGGVCGPGLLTVPGLLCTHLEGGRGSRNSTPSASVDPSLPPAPTPLCGICDRLEPRLVLSGVCALQGRRSVADWGLPSVEGSSCCRSP